jgi:hypothetical protein
VSFSAEFEIDSAVGQVSGTKSAQDLPLGPSDGFCDSREDPPLFFASGHALATYEATIETSSGIFTDRGTTEALVFDREEPARALFEEQFQESFVSDLTEPEQLLPTTREQCKDGGYERFGFKNQGDCVRFTQAQGRNEASKNQ